MNDGMVLTYPELQSVTDFVIRLVHSNGHRSEICRIFRAQIEHESMKFNQDPEAVMAAVREAMEIQ